MRSVHFITRICVVALVVVCIAAQDKCYYLSLSTAALYDAATNGKRVGGCYISRNTGSGFCDLYVIAATTGNQGHKGWPRSTNDLGTGCVKAPDFPKSQSYCFFESNDYSQWPITERTSFCTDKGVTNAVAQLRHAIRNNQCNL